MSLSPPSILLPSRPSTNSLSSDDSSASNRYSNSSASSASSHTSADTPTNDKHSTPMSPPTSSLRIRFAPLPDPRRSVLVDELPLPLPIEVKVEAPLPSLSSNSPTASPLSTHPHLPVHNHSASAPPPSSYTPPRIEGKSATWPKPRSLLRSFRRGANTPASSTDSLTPTPSLETPLADLGLTRWASSTSVASTNGGSPLARTQSQSSVAAPKKRGRALFGSRDSEKKEGKKKSTSVPPVPALNPFASSAGKRGTRMLNGRVYGGKNNAANPFASARDEEPTFVEWGYGGMGSVKNNAHGHSAWGKVQSNAATSTPNGAANGHVGMGVVSGGDDDDDGSGMGWVKRRREAREREAREAAKQLENPKEGEKEKEGPEAGDGESMTTTTPTGEVAPHPHPHAPPDLPSPLALPSPPFGSPSLGSGHAPPFSASPLGTPALPSASSGEEHVLRAVTLPAHFRGHHHSHQRSSSNALAALAAAQDAKPKPASVSSSESMSSSNSDEESDSEDEDGKAKAAEGSVEPAAAKGGKAAEEEEADDEDEDEDEDDEAEEVERRRTALSAGVEKISRHKE
ncbi:hypothetical protein DFH07DRAFT_535234 [Mycena maculata]|uniref:Uncharacterized protein n=1 Tax=Mycena maculata TaxID=230809 RepID=A0AAD7K787_9AGAR|nr:hypothetical protein DFH07DRAFT_535234 [Mycena maculata]